MKKVFLLFMISILSLNHITGQISISGKVIDKETEEGIPFANVYLKGTTSGTATDIDGQYAFSFSEKPDSIFASALGYQTIGIPYNGQSTLNFLLIADDLTLSEVVVVAGENPANAIVKNIIKNKKKNQIKSQESYTCERYSKIELDIQNLFNTDSLPDEEEMNMLIARYDTTSDEQPFLPFYLYEYLADVYFLKNKSEREIIKAQKSAGIDNQSVIDQIKRFHEPYDVYNNWIPILEKNFVSPFSNTGLLFYEYYIMDSTFIENQWSYKLKFKPKRKQENTFFGDFWVIDTSFAIARVNMRMSPDANLNLVDRAVIYEEYQYTNDSLWVPSKQKLIVDLEIEENTIGMIARKTVTHKDFEFNQTTHKAEYKDHHPQDVVYQETWKQEEYWDSTRHESLTTGEEGIYEMVDTIMTTPTFERFQKVMYFGTTSYWPLGKIDFGPVANIYNLNYVEGNRFYLGFQTNKKFHEKLRFRAYTAYGTLDKKFKYGGQFQWNIRQDQRRTILGANYINDIVFNHTSTEEPVELNIINGFLRRNTPNRLLFTREAKAYFLKEWKNGIESRIIVMNRFLDPFGGDENRGFNFKYLPDPNDLSQVDSAITTSEVMLKLRWAKDENYYQDNFDRISLGSRKPILQLNFIKGFSGFMGSEYNYNKVSFSVSHWVFTNPIGWFRYRIDAGKTFGTLPSLLLEVHPADETYIYQPDAFNNMNRYEFTSDTYVRWILVHHFDGAILNKVPLLKKLEWRSFTSFRGTWGTLTDENRAVNQLNTSDIAGNIPFRTPDAEPYMEFSVGIENIFKIFTIQGNWRLNYLDNPEAPRFTIQGSTYFYF